jgi:vacuolar protein sorting-associated protein 45
LISDSYLRELAEADIHSQIKNVQELYLDYMILNSNLYHLNIDSSISLISDTNLWSKYDHYIFDRIVEGLLSVCLSNRLLPVIKTTKGSMVCNMLAQRLYELFEKNFDFIRKECGRDTNGILLLFDRKEDPVTPLLNQWTYQAMIHELIGINNNILEIKKDGDVEKIVLSDIDDKFFSNNINNDIGDVASKVKELVETMNKEQTMFNKQAADTMADIKKLIDKIPEKKKESAEITKHTNIVYELTELMENRNLLNLSSIEQEIACSDNKSNHFTKVSAIIKDKTHSPLDKAKLFLLYCLRYEGDNTVSSLKSLLMENQMKDWIEYLDYLYLYAGKSKRALDVFNNKDFFAMGKSKLISAFKNIPNVFTQHTSYMPTILEKVIKGKDLNNLETFAFPNQKER